MIMNRTQGDLCWQCATTGIATGFDCSVLAQAVSVNPRIGSSQMPVKKRTCLATTGERAFEGNHLPSWVSGTHSDLPACGSIPNGSSLTVVQTTRLFIFLPKDFYPNIKLNVTSHGAFASSVTNADVYGYAQSRSARSDCWFLCTSSDASDERFSLSEMYPSEDFRGGKENSKCDNKLRYRHTINGYLVARLLS